MPEAAPALDDHRPRVARDSDATAVYCGIARDEANALPAVLASIAAATRDVFRGGAACLFYENDSVDGTGELARRWGAAPATRAAGVRRVDVLSDALDEPRKRPSHSFLAKCRNKCLAAVERLVEEERAWLGTPTVVMLDLDLTRGFLADGVASSLRVLLETNAACVASNGICTPAGHLFDAFAFRRKAFASAPLPYDPAVFGTLDCYWAALNLDAARRPALAPSLPPIKVDCAFGGLALYASRLRRPLAGGGTRSRKGKSRESRSQRGRPRPRRRRDASPRNVHVPE